MAARGEWILFTDIDHILTNSVLDAAEEMSEEHPMIHFRRHYGELDETGKLININPEELKPHMNTFVISKERFEALGGYDESFCGKYGGDDKDFLARYRKMFGEEGMLSPTPVFVYPPGVGKFHELERK